MRCSEAAEAEGFEPQGGCPPLALMDGADSPGPRTPARMSRYRQATIPGSIHATIDRVRSRRVTAGQCWWAQQSSNLRPLGNRPADVRPQCHQSAPVPDQTRCVRLSLRRGDHHAGRRDGLCTGRRRGDGHHPQIVDAHAERVVQPATTPRGQRQHPIPALHRRHRIPANATSPRCGELRGAANRPGVARRRPTALA